jgi:metallo-beta-lactamase family protein
MPGALLKQRKQSVAMKAAGRQHPKPRKDARRSKSPGNPFPTACLIRFLSSYLDSHVYHVDMRKTNPTVTFWGAAQSVSGSMHLIEAGEHKVLLDCGLHLGQGSVARERNTYLPFDPKALDAVVLSHAHIDHCGNVPNLVRRGYEGPIYCTPATRDLLGVMLHDSARIQEEQSQFHRMLDVADDVNGQPLYHQGDVNRAISQCVAVGYDSPVSLPGEMELRLADAGHVLGSATISVSMRVNSHDRTVAFTGDLGRAGLPFLHPPAPLPTADLLVCESTYGGRFHQSLEKLAETLANTVTRTLNRGGKVLIPAFSLGRAQIVVYYLQEWMESGRMPRATLYVDSALAASIGDIYRLHPDHLAPQTLHRLAEAPEGSVHYVRALSESRELSRRREPCVLVASGGMCEAGRILRHLEQHIDDPRSSIVLVSYQAPQSLGHRLRERGPTVTFHGKLWNKWAEVIDLNGFSGHADHNDLLTQLKPLAGRTKVRLVHGSLESASALAKDLTKLGFEDVGIPARGEGVEVGR